MRRLDQRGLDFIKEFEGFSTTLYLDSAGLPTIGYGHLIGPGENLNKITQAEAEKLLAKDVSSAENAVNKLITAPLTQNQFNALVSFTYNIGSGALQRSTLRMKVNREDEDAPEEFHRWVFAGGRKVKGLIRRRAAEAALYEEEVWKTEDLEDQSSQLVNALNSLAMKVRNALRSGVSAS